MTKYKNINIKWILKGLPNFVITINNEIWQLPFISGRNHYGYRQIKEKIHQNQIKYRLNSKWYTKKQLNDLAIPKEFILQTNIVIKEPFENENKQSR
jgi:hypothetical protein